MRKILKQNNKIELRHLSSGGKEVFKINSLIGEGGACVVYSATRNNRKGVLKEFYPTDYKDSYNILNRTDKNQLVASGTAYIKRFNEMCREFKEGYDLLETANFKSGKNLISNYVPEYEIYAGTEENSTIYIWTKQSAGITLESYISDIWKNSKTQTEFKLYNVLTVIKSIALGVCGMHIQGLMHRDIKPDNFLIAKDGMNNINPYQVSMFDVNSFCYGTSSKYIVGTDGYAAPEVKKGQSRYYSDIYSLGAVIFTGVVNNGCYKIEQYQDLEKLIEESKLLLNINDIYIKAQLLELLKKSLAENPRHRYEETEEFISDLDKIIVRLLPHTMAKKITDSNQRLKIIEERKPIDAIPIFQDLLFKHPVFEWFSESEDINVLVIGGGLYGQAFLDVALTTLQLKDKNLNVTVVTESPNYDKSIYLKKRPDLERFFDIDKKESEKDATAYGSINFIEGKFKSKGHENDEIIKRILNKTNPCYILVSLGDDILNNTVAKSIVDTNVKALVNFVWSGREKKFQKGNPVYINKNIEYNNIHENLLQMAFNTHLTWSDAMDADIDMLYSEFKKPYNFKSSIAFALSIQYKLHSVGLSLDEVKNDLEKISFSVNNENQKKLLKELSWIEHRRWVTDKVTLGWRAPLNDKGDADTELCLEFNDNKSAKRKLHLCIVKSTTEATPAKKMWDTCNIEDLDPLDKVSIEIYRHFKAFSDDFKKNKFIKVCSQIEYIKNNITIYNANLIRLTNEFEDAVNSIVKDENSIYFYKYTQISNKLQNKIENTNIQNKNEILYMLKDINSQIRPLIMANAKIDYKLIDEELIRNMAYIISHRPRPKMAVFFSEEDKNKELAKNVISCMKIIPKCLKYLYYYTPDVNMQELIQAINGTLTFFKKKNMKHITRFVFAFPGKVPEGVKEELNEVLGAYNAKAKYYENISNGINATRLFFVECKNDYLIDGSSLPFDNSEENDYCAAQMKKLKYFEFDISKNKFFNTTCPYLKYLHIDKNKLSVPDLFVLKNTSSSFSNPDMNMFYEKMWEIYAGEGDMKDNIKIWNSLSEKLSRYSEDKDVLASFSYNNNNGEFEYLEKIMPMFCYDGCKLIINELLQQNVLKTGDISILNKDSFKIRISYDREYSQIPGVFSDYDVLGKRIKTLDTQQGDKKVFKILYDNIFVKDIELDSREYFCLKRLSDAEFINDLCVVNKTGNKATELYSVSFSYPSESIKRLICHKDTVLKLYVYYSLLRSGDFDDIRWNAVIGEPGESNNFDIILTKNNKTVFIVFNKSHEMQSVLNNVKNYGLDSTLICISDDNSENKEVCGCDVFYENVSENISSNILRIIDSI